MANNFNANPLRITNSFQSYKSQVASILGTLFSFKITKVYWENPAASGDQCLIIGSNGLQILSMRCESNNQSQVFDWTAFPLLIQDFSVPQIDSGTLYVFYEI